jgi:thiamine pyrophosphokinase
VSEMDFCQRILRVTAFPQPYTLLVSGAPVAEDVDGVRCAGLAMSLAAQADFILAADSGANILAKAGIRPDLLLGDFDSIDPEALAGFRNSGVALQAYDRHKDATDIELALLAAQDRGCQAIIAVNVLGGRLDHELASLGALAAVATKGIRVMVLRPTEASLFLAAPATADVPTAAGKPREAAANAAAPAAGQPREAAANADAPTAGQPREAAARHSRLGLDFSGIASPSYLSLIPWGGDAVVSISGVEWELQQKRLTPYDTLGVSNQPRSKQVEVSIFAGTAIVIVQA